MRRKCILAGSLALVILFSQLTPRASAAGICDWAKFVSDVTVSDGASFPPGAPFVKTWRLQNIGTCTWSTSYSLVHYSGERMSTVSSVSLNKSVAPGEMVDISVNMVAPLTGGLHDETWIMNNASGARFGISSNAAMPIWVTIFVVESNMVAFDFVANAPYAQWKSGAGVLPFPGTSGDSRGYALKLDYPRLEDGSFDPQPGLLTVPRNVYNGYIQATYPEFIVQQGDRLQTTVNCEYGTTDCYATFRVDAMLPNGAVTTLWTFTEAYEGRVYHATINLDSLAGKNVKFILMVLAAGSASGDRALWGAPRILRTGSGTPPAPATLTPLPPLTPTATPFSIPPTILPAACDRATFIADVRIPDGMLFTPGAAFTKTWRLMNSGYCTWTTAYSLVFYSGDQMSAPTSVNFPYKVVPGQMVDLTVNMVAPIPEGKYRGFWVLRNASGVLFGIGKNANQAFWVEINVSGGTPTEMGYDFQKNACSALWRSGAGTLPCPGVEGDSRGFVSPLNYTRLEDGTTGPAPSLLMEPQHRYNGYIQGIYPAFTVQPGDIFRASVGCEYGYSCYVTFGLAYMTSLGSVHTLWTRREQNDGQNHDVNVSLTPLVGLSVRFILTVYATGSSNDDRVRWIAPTIIRAGGGPVPATLTPVPPPTSSLTPTVSPVPPPTSTPTVTATSEAVVSSPRIRRLFMIDAARGWAIADSTLLRTTDGGSTWYNVTMTGVSTVANGFFQDFNRGWVLATLSDGNQALFRTTDGGRTWARYNNIPFNGSYIQFLDDSHGVVLSILGAAMNKQSVALYQTSDGGATWVRNYINDPTVPGASNSLPLGGHKNGMTFRDGSTGWVGGDIPTPGFVYLYKTTDGGVTWSQQALTLPAGYESAYIIIEAPKFFGMNDALLPVRMSTTTSRDLFVYASHDGGATWILSAGVATQAKNVDFVSLNDGFAWNWNGFFLVTHNSGSSWSQITPNINFGDNLPYMDFVSMTTGWAIQNEADGSTSLYRTTDGCVTWTLLVGNATTPTSTP